MLLITHILIAMISILFATLLFFSPSNFKFRANYLLLGATLASGTFLVVDRGSHLVESCLMGLVYTGAVFTAIILAKKKFVRQTNDY
ncbi:MAG TPA: hypothetical protein VFX79_01285 [Candidatus Saccharimonadales bacterium]|nr:hypothetical protein [Candidatus Saccharimonadales bacterium]